MTMAEVAKLAGVSQATVSRVVNEGGNVSPATVEAVRAAMSEIGYPGPRRRTRRDDGRGGTTIALLMLDRTHAEHPHMSMLKLAGVREAAMEAGVNLLLADAAAEPGGEGDLPPMLAKGEAAGFALWGRSLPQGVRRLIGRKPIVWLSSHEGEAGEGDVVLEGNAEVGRIACEYLVGRGAGRLAFLCPEPRKRQLLVRGHVFAAIAESRGLTVHLLASEADDRATDAHHRTRRLVDRLVAVDPAPDGLFIPDDRFVAAAYDQLKRRGVQPGQAVAVVSCNNERAYLDPLDPRPASIDLAPEVSGRMAVKRLLDQINGQQIERAVSVTVQPRLVEGD